MQGPSGSLRDISSTSANLFLWKKKKVYVFENFLRYNKGVDLVALPVYPVRRPTNLSDTRNQKCQKTL